MHLVLTHEQADFDAIAAAYAVHLLDPEAVPVLPRRINRNVRAFLTLHGRAQHFVEFDEIPEQPAAQITLVDTHSLPSLSGVGKDTRVHVIDHHPDARKLDPGWTHHMRPVGSATTILTEELRQSGRDPDYIDATLLLLGIYEDTGSLTYAGTTSADLAAAAWLVDKGADLSLASDFLNPPLTQEQRRLYEALLESAQPHTFHGLNVLMAAATVDEPVDEISTVTHKLRDVFDPAGLFVLVEHQGTVQMVARSSSDHIDVAAIAAEFGGGGHGRAAAALVRDRSLNQVTAEVLAELEARIEPPATVAEIMSRDPQVLAPGTTVAEAAERMQRSGHEGYPVVDGGRVVGLLSRRAVDRAIGHGLTNRPIRSVMEAGAVTVRPGDSIEALQQVMMRSDWGQVPVIDPADGNVIGIVTRTDLLRRLATSQDQARSDDVAAALEGALAPARLALLQAVASQAESAGVALYVVGGFVRDLLLGQPSTDLDLVTEGDAIALAESLGKRYGGSVSSHRRFGTAKWQLDPDSAKLAQAGIPAGEHSQLPASLDFVTARSEFYQHPSALPTVEHGSIKLDLHRRDFTINTLALRLDGRQYGRLLDHWGGGDDLERKLVRVLHSLSFVDDPTRMLRAVRLEQRLGFEIEPRTLHLLGEAVVLLARVSGDRVWSELRLAFAEPKAAEIMARFAGLGLLEAIHPDLKWGECAADAWMRVSDFSPPSTWGLQSDPDREFLRLATLCCGNRVVDAKSICERLRLPLRLTAAVADTVLALQHAEQDSEDAPSVWVDRLDPLAEQALVAAWLALGEEHPFRRVLDQYLAVWRHIQPRTNGAKLQALGLPPGPAYRRILGELRSQWLDGKITDAEAEGALLESLLDRAQSDD